MYLQHYIHTDAYNELQDVASMFKRSMFEREGERAATSFVCVLGVGVRLSICLLMWCVLV